MSTCSFLACIFWYPFLWLPSHSTAVVRWKSLRIEKKLSFVAGGRPSWEEILTRKHKDMEMVTWLEKNGQLCESVFHLPFGEFQDSHESVLKSVEEPLFEHVPLWEAMPSRWRMWKSMAQRLPDGFFLWSLITGPCMPINANYIWKGCDYFCLSFGLIPELEGQHVSFHGLKPWVWWDSIRSCTWALAWTPFILGYLDRKLGTCQRSAGSLRIRLLILRIWVVHRFFIAHFHSSSQLQSSNTFSCKPTMFFPGFGVPWQLEETLWTVIW